MKKKDNKLYPVDLKDFERKTKGLLVGSIAANLFAIAILAAAVAVLLFDLDVLEATEVRIHREHIEKPVLYTEKNVSEVVPPPTTTAPTAEAPRITEEDIELLALVAMAEAEGESLEGKRLVIDTVLNRVDSPNWPNTIREVLYQPNQFVAMTNGRADLFTVEGAEIPDEVWEIVCEELKSRTNTEVVYFTAGGYGQYGTPLFKVGNHYFCK